MEERLPLLRGKVSAEAKAVDKKLAELSSEWEAGRPLSKENTPSEVMSCSEFRKCGRSARDNSTLSTRVFPNNSLY